VKRETRTAIRNYEREIAVRKYRIQVWEDRNNHDRAEIERLLSEAPEMPHGGGGEK